GGCASAELGVAGEGMAWLAAPADAASSGRAHERAVASDPMRSALGVVFIAALASIAAAQARPPAPPAAPAPPAPPTPAAPIGAWTPVPELPGMGRPVDTASVAARRRAVAARIGRG